MSNQPRVAKVLIMLVVSMTMGAAVLMALGNNAPAAGPFCLSSYYCLDGVEKSTMSRAAQFTSRWSCIQIYYSYTKAGNIEQLASLNGLAEAEDLNSHFVICNGLGGEDGEILATEKWQKQWSAVAENLGPISGQTIRICVIADPLRHAVSDSQVKRTEALVESLYRKFNIGQSNIYYPKGWE